MCLLIIATQPAPGIDYVIAHNRDEYVSRPYENAKIREYGSEKIICGLDAAGQGTWAALKQNGDFACVHNIRNKRFLPKSNHQSRGKIPLHLLSVDTHNFKDIDFKPFTSIHSDFNRTITVKSYDGTKTKEQVLDYNCSDIFGVSNLPIDSHCAKTELAKKSFKEIFIKNSNFSDANLIKKIMSLMTSNLKNNYTPDTGYSAEVEHALSANFIKTEHYQTLTTTIIIKKTEKAGIFLEIDHIKDIKNEICF